MAENKKFLGIIPSGLKSFKIAKELAEKHIGQINDNLIKNSGLLPEKDAESPPSPLLEKAQGKKYANIVSSFFPQAKSIDYSGNPGQNPGYRDKQGGAMPFAMLKSMANRNHIVATVIKLYCSKVASHSRVSGNRFKNGFRIKLKNENEALKLTLRRMFPDKFKKQSEEVDFLTGNIVATSEASRQRVLNDSDPINDVGGFDYKSQIKRVQSPEENELTEKDMYDAAEKELAKVTGSTIKAMEELVKNCGSLKGRPFKDQRWEFRSYLEATVRDSLIYDFIATELVWDGKDDPYYWKPVDASTIRFSMPNLKNQRDLVEDNVDKEGMFPEERKFIEDQRNYILTLDQKKLDLGEYKFVQLKDNRIVRAYTDKEMFVGIRNMSTDVNLNGYSYSELELLVRMIYSHVYTENLTATYFTQGFSAKGIVHIKDDIDPRKTEDLRDQWNYMLKGGNNANQTPIITGTDEVKWIPLNQQRDDMEFQNWMNYLIKIICSMYQIDPIEIGFDFRAEGGRGGGSLNAQGMSQKISISKSKGYISILRMIETYINKNIIDRFNSNYELEFTGIGDESQEEFLQRLMNEAKTYKTLNEMRKEAELNPIQGADIVLNQDFILWYNQFSHEGKERAKELATQQMELEVESQKRLKALGIMPGQNSGSSSSSGGKKKSDPNKAPIKTKYDRNKTKQSRALGVKKSVFVEYEVDEDEE